MKRCHLSSTTVDVLLNGAADLDRRCGIYGIVHLETWRAYIGSTGNFTKRWRQHIHGLRNHRPKENTHLQAVWDTDGEGAFAFVALEVCNEQKLAARETWWMMEWRRCYGALFNIALTGYGGGASLPPSSNPPLMPLATALRHYMLNYLDGDEIVETDDLNAFALSLELRPMVFYRLAKDFERSYRGREHCHGWKILLIDGQLRRW